VVFSNNVAKGEKDHAELEEELFSRSASLKSRTTGSKKISTAPLLTKWLLVEPKDEISIGQQYGLLDVARSSYY
jgi:hypothetical protein